MCPWGIQLIIIRPLASKKNKVVTKWEMSLSILNTRLVVKAGIEIKPRLLADAPTTEGLLLYAVGDTIRYANNANTEFVVQTSTTSDAVPVVVNSPNASVNGSVNDTLLIAHTAVSSVTVTLPPISAVPLGRVLRFIDTGNNAGTNNIILAADGSDKIQSTESSLTMNIDGTAITMICDGTGWKIL